VRGRDMRTRACWRAAGPSHPGSAASAGSTTDERAALHPPQAAGHGSDIRSLSTLQASHLTGLGGRGGAAAACSDGVQGARPTRGAAAAALLPPLPPITGCPPYWQCKLPPSRQLRAGTDTIEGVRDLQPGLRTPFAPTRTPDPCLEHSYAAHVLQVGSRALACPQIGAKPAERPERRWHVVQRCSAGRARHTIACAPLRPAGTSCWR
jgi:hypothetical protein